MKPLTGKEPISRRNALGHYRTLDSQRFEIEPSDINTVRANYLGFQYKTHRFKSDDVGRQLEVLSNGNGWTCWTFISR